MGMFDTVRCSYDLGPGFWNKELQTKDLDCLMAEYWLDPIGRLWEIDYSGTYDFQMGDDFNIPRTVPNGNHGRIRPTNITELVEVYPAKWSIHYAPFPRMRILFKNGLLSEILP